MNLLTEKDIIKIQLEEQDFYECVRTALKVTPGITDRHDLHSRDVFERFLNVLQGEVAEQMVIKWLKSNNKFAESTVDKESASPDAGHDIKVLSNEGQEIFASIKSSISALKKPSEILKIFKLSTKKSEVRQVNIQVYFWYDLYPGRGLPRMNLLSLNNAAIICWAGSNDLLQGGFNTYNNENREVSSKKLEEHRSMQSLLLHLR